MKKSEQLHVEKQERDSAEKLAWFDRNVATPKQKTNLTPKKKKRKK